MTFRKISAVLLLFSLIASGTRAEGPSGTPAPTPTPGAVAIPGGPGAEKAEQTKDDPELTTADTNVEIEEVLYTKDFVQFSPIETISPDVIQWEKNSAKFLYIAKNRFPFLYLMGNLAEGYEMSVNNKWVSLKPGRRFEQKISIPLEPGTISIRIFGPDRKFELYRMATFWIKLPPSIRAKIKDGEFVVEKVTGFADKIKRAGFVQLFSDSNPVTVVDLDSLRNARLTFRLFTPPEVEPTYDAWSLVIRDSQNRIVSEVKRLGNPPMFLDWREGASKVTMTDTYTYSLNLYKDGDEYEGKSNQFDTVEGLSLMNHAYHPAITLEPKQELGFFRFNDNTGFTTSNVYIGADLTVSFWNRLLLRGAGLMSLHQSDPRSFFTYTRLGAGYRYSSMGEKGSLGSTYFYRIDFLVNVTGHTVYEGAPLNRYTHVSFLLEPSLVLWGYHYIVPTFELGTRPTGDQLRYLLGLNYYYFIRPWSLKLGVGFTWEELSKAEGNELGKFRIFRSGASFIFFI